MSTNEFRVHMTVWDVNGVAHEAALTLAEYEALMNQMPTPETEKVTA